MLKPLSGALVAAALASTTLALPVPAFADSFGVSVNTGNVAFGYRDGYWDHNHQWHRWHNRHEARQYRDADGSQYNDYNHNRYGDDGYIALNVDDVAFGYRDGYWDQGHQWHTWRNENEARYYRHAHGDQYKDFNHDHDGGDGWHR
jgi:beta-galactosidase GanA